MNDRDLAEELLAEMEDDPLGLGFLDVERLLDLWGVTGTLDGEPMMGYRTRFHPRCPAKVFHYRQSMELAPASIRGICSALRTLIKRLSL